MPDIKSAMSAALLRAPAPVQQLVQTTLKEWDDEGEKHFPINISSVDPKPVKKKRGGSIKNNVMRETFNFINNNPGMTCKMIATRMEKDGFKPSSVTSVVSQLWRSEQLQKDGITYRTAVPEYLPMSASTNARITRLKKRVEELKVVAKSKGITALPVKSGGIAALAPMPAPELPKYRPRPEASHVKPFDPKDILNPLTVYQARALYNELEAMFGGGYGRSA
jgi:hypothetical protein